MKILDLKKELKYLYAPSAKKVEIVQVPRLQFAIIDGAIEKDMNRASHPHSPRQPRRFTESRTRSSSCSRNAKEKPLITP